MILHFIVGKPTQSRGDSKINHNCWSQVGLHLAHKHEWQGKDHFMSMTHFRAYLKQGKFACI